MVAARVRTHQAMAAQLERVNGQPSGDDNLIELLRRRLSEAEAEIRRLTAELALSGVQSSVQPDALTIPSDEAARKFSVSLPTLNRALKHVSKNRVVRPDGSPGGYQEPSGYWRIHPDARFIRPARRSRKRAGG